MDICGVRYFLAVCETGSFTEAARRCGVSQPSVTTAVRRLERVVGGDLLVRRRPVRLTPLGAALRPAFEVMRQASNTIAAVTAEAAQPARSKRRPAAEPAGAARLAAAPTGCTCGAAGASTLCRFPGTCRYQIVAESLRRPRRASPRRPM